MKRIARYLLIWLFFFAFLQGTLAASYIGGTTPFIIFQSLGVELKEKIATTYFAWDGLLIQGRVIDNKDRVFIFLKNTITQEVFTEWVFVDKFGNFSIPVSLPKSIGDYYIAIISANTNNESFKLSNPEILKLISKNDLNNISVTDQSISPYVIYGRSPYVNIGSDKWANMQIDQLGKRYITSWKILILNDSPLTLGRARVTINWYALSSGSPLDQIPSLGFNWSGYVYIDRTREKIWENLVALRVQQSLGIMNFRIKAWEKVQSEYFLTSPNGNVTKYTFPTNFIDTNWFLRTNVTIRQNFPMTESGVYKIETVRSNGIAYFNLPISKSQFWSIVESISESQKMTLKSDKKVIEKDILARVNAIRRSLGVPLLITDSQLTKLAWLKAIYLSEHDDVIHITKDWFDIRGFWNSQWINISWSIAENVSKWNISHLYLQDWLEESGSHRYAMIKPLFKKIGIGYAIKNWKTYLVQVFGE